MDRTALTFWQAQQFTCENNNFMQNISSMFFFTFPNLFHHPSNIHYGRRSYPIPRDWFEITQSRWKNTHFWIQVSPSIFGFFSISSPLHPASFHRYIGLIILNTNFDRETCTPILSVFLVCFQPKKYLSLCKALIFSFILVYTWVRRVINEYIIIYTTRKD